MPVNTTPAILKHAIVGGNYSDTMTVQSDRVSTPVSFALARGSSLPPGLTLNKSTGAITGRPTKEGQYRIRTVALNLSGSSNEIESALTVFPIPAGVAGSYAGPIARHAVLNGNLGGRFEMTTTVLGAYSGRIVLGSGAARTFKGI